MDVPTPIAIPDIPLEAVSAQATAVFSVFWPLLAILLGVVLGVFVFRRVRSAIARRM